MQFTFFEMYTIFISLRSRADNKEVVVPRMFNRFFLDHLASGICGMFDFHNVVLVCWLDSLERGRSFVIENMEIW